MSQNTILQFMYIVDVKHYELSWRNNNNYRNLFREIKKNYIRVARIILLSGATLKAYRGPPFVFEKLS